MSTILPPNEQIAGRVWNPLVRDTAVVLGGLILGVAAAYLVVDGDWQIAVSLIFALPGLVILLKYPFFAVIIWLLLEPFLLHTNTDAERRLYWIIHRALPVLTLAIILLSAALRINQRKLPKLGLPELFMLGYVIHGLLSIALLNNDPLQTTYRLYDQVFSPMCIYLIVRLSAPDLKQFYWLILTAFFISFSQSMIGILSWFVPQTLPSDWLSKAGSRTTGSLVNTSIFSTTLIFSGLLVLQAAFYTRSEIIRKVLFGAFLLSLYSIFITFSRAAWFAGTLVLVGLISLYPRFFLKVGLMLIPVTLLFGGLLFSDQAAWARNASTPPKPSGRR
jgi:hypothetical protein